MSVATRAHQLFRPEDATKYTPLADTTKLRQVFARAANRALEEDLPEDLAAGLGVMAVKRQIRRVKRRK